MSASSGERTLRRRVPLQLARGDGLVNSRQILIHDPPGAEIEMAYFGVAHLTIGQANIGATRAQFPARIIAIELVVERRAREESGISVFFAFLSASRINSPTVADDQHDRACHSAHCRDDWEDRQAVSRAC